jgi:two-component system chemotaxis sensor kinase CheA
VLSLVVAPELISIETLGVVAAAESEPAPARMEPTPEPQAAAPVAAANELDEFFVDPAEFRKMRSVTAEPRPMAMEASAAEADSLVDLFVTPEQFKKDRVPRAAAMALAATSNATAADVHDPMLPASHEATFIRVSTEKIDLLVNLVGELVITEAMLARTGALADAGNDGRYAANTGLADLSRHTRNLQEAVLAIRMLPISNVFQRFPRVVHELSARLGKRVDLKMFGEATELDRGLIEKISDLPDAPGAQCHRPRAGKRRRRALPPASPRRARSTLRASQRGGNIIIEVSDDGRGLDRGRILARARQRGMALSDDAPDSEVFQLVFEAGFSTAEKVTDVSGPRGRHGRGQAQHPGPERHGRPELGGGAGHQGDGQRALDAGHHGGDDHCHWRRNLCAAAGLRGGVPQRGERRIAHASGHGDTLRVREEYLPVLQPGTPVPSPKPARAIGWNCGDRRTDGSKAALLVDELVGQQQVVVKSLETNFRKVPGLSGATVMGDGSVP